MRYEAGKEVTFVSCRLCPVHMYTGVFRPLVVSDAVHGATDPIELSARYQKIVFTIQIWFGFTILNFEFILTKICGILTKIFLCVCKN